MREPSFVLSPICNVCIISAPSRLQTERRASLSLVRGARRAAYSQGLLRPIQIHRKATPQVKRVSSCKPCFVCSECSSSGRPVCNRWPILPASPRRFSSRSYEAPAFLSERRVVYQIYGMSACRSSNFLELRAPPTPTTCCNMCAKSWLWSPMKEHRPFPARIIVLPCWGRRSL